MAKRRAISEIVAVTIMLAVIATASFLALNNASKRINESQQSIHDALESKGSQVQEAISIISKESTSNVITVELLNYGLKDITVTEVLVDGAGSQYTIIDYNNAIQGNKIVRNKILTLQIPKSGQTVQIITSTKNILEITI